jgi:glycosyltransferase involved in cell wall biosynthesis
MKRRHVVSIVTNRVEGDSRVIKTAKAALNAGYDATIIGVSKGIKIEELTIEQVRVIRIPNFAGYLKKYDLWTPGPERRDIGLLVDGYAREVLPLIVALMPDLIHSHDMNGLKLGALSRRVLESTGHPVAWVHDLHELVYGLKGEIAESYLPMCLEWERAYLHTADHLVTVSDPLAAKVAERYHLPGRPTVVYNAPSVRDFTNTGPDVRTVTGLLQDIPLVVFVGGAHQLRGCETILRAVAQLAEVHLVFVSEGPYVQRLAALAAELGVAERFHAHPYVSSDRVTSFIRTADLGINGLVHYPNGEVAMPTKMFEYLNAGLPIVASDVEGMRGFVEEHGVGEIFIAEEVDSCAAAIRTVLQSKAKYRDRITPELLQQFCWERQEEKLQSIYQGLLDTRSIVTDSQRQRAIDEIAAERLLFEVGLSRAMSAAALDRLAVSNKILKGLHKRTAPAPAKRNLRFYVTALKTRIAKYGMLSTARFVAQRLLRRIANIAKLTP